MTPSTLVSTSTSPFGADAPPRRGDCVMYRPRRQLDPRLYQIAALGSLLIYGIARLDFDLPLHTVALILGAALATQHACSRAWKLPTFEPRSALISGLSLCLLLRTTDPRWAVLGAIIAVSSKFVLRVDGKHMFNPTNFGLVTLMLLTDRAWVSSGQWGSTAFFGFLLISIGSMVVHRSSRSDVTWSFLFFYAAVLVARSLWLGEPWSIPLHRLQSGALLLFAFFMISDPRTTPDSRIARVLYALVVALGAGWVQFGLFANNGLLWSLAISTPLVPLLNRFLPGSRYEWPRERSLRTQVAMTMAHSTTTTRLGARVGAWMARLHWSPQEREFIDET